MPHITHTGRWLIAASLMCAMSACKTTPPQQDDGLTLHQPGRVTRPKTFDDDALTALIERDNLAQPLAIHRVDLDGQHPEELVLLLPYRVNDAHPDPCEALSTRAQVVIYDVTEPTYPIQLAHDTTPATIEVGCAAQLHTGPAGRDGSPELMLTWQDARGAMLIALERAGNTLHIPFRLERALGYLVTDIEGDGHLSVVILGHAAAFATIHTTRAPLTIIPARRKRRADGYEEFEPGHTAGLQQSYLRALDAADDPLLIAKHLLAMRDLSVTPERLDEALAILMARVEHLQTSLHTTTPAHLPHRDPYDDVLHAHHPEILLLLHALAWPNQPALVTWGLNQLDHTRPTLLLSTLIATLLKASPDDAARRGLVLRFEHALHTLEALNDSNLFIEKIENYQKNEYDNAFKTTRDALLFIETYLTLDATPQSQRALIALMRRVEGRALHDVLLRSPLQAWLTPHAIDLVGRSPDPERDALLLISMLPERLERGALSREEREALRAALHSRKKPTDAASSQALFLLHTHFHHEPIEADALAVARHLRARILRKQATAEEHTRADRLVGVIARFAPLLSREEQRWWFTRFDTHHADGQLRYALISTCNNAWHDDTPLPESHMKLLIRAAAWSRSEYSALSECLLTLSTEMDHFSATTQRELRAALIRQLGPDRDTSDLLVTLDASRTLHHSAIDRAYRAILEARPSPDDPAHQLARELLEKTPTTSESSHDATTWR